MLYWLWPNDSAVCRQPIAPSTPPRRQRSNQLKPFAGLTQKPYCVLCEHAAAYPHVPPPASPDAITSPPSGSPGILVGCIAGAAAHRLAPVTRAERRGTVLADLVRYFGQRAAVPLEYREYPWGEDAFTRGAAGGAWSPGLWTAYGHALRGPIGVLHWAGAETATVWQGTMEGALRAEVLAALG